MAEAPDHPSAPASGAPSAPVAAPASPFARPWRIAGHVAGFLLGASLLAACVWYALRDETVDPWRAMREADPRLLIGLLLSSLVSLVLNATTFWLVIRPVKDVGWLNMQRVNAVANALNYAPFRLGLVLRVLYHLRIDRLTLVQIGAWFAAIALVLLMVVSVAFVSLMIRPGMDWAWVGLMVGGLALGSVCTMAFMGNPLMVRYGRGADRMLRSPRVLVWLIVLRLLDIGAFALRLACAAGIVGLKLPSSSTSYVVMLAIVALLAGLIPIRIGFREALVGFAAATLGAEGVDESSFAMLALIESAGEALVYVPLGAVCLLWYVRTWRARAGKAPSVTSAEVASSDG